MAAVPGLLPPPPAAAPFDYEAVLQLFKNSLTADLVESQVLALTLVARHNSEGFQIAHLGYVRDVLSVGFMALEQRGRAFVQPLCALMRLVGMPYRRSKSFEEHAAGAVAALSDILRVLVAVLMWNESEIQLEAARALLSFVVATGFDAPGVHASAAEAASKAGADFESESQQTSWSFHQHLLREADVLPDLVRALRHQVTAYLEEAQLFKAQTARLLQATVHGQRRGTASSQAWAAPPQSLQQQQKQQSNLGDREPSDLLVADDDSEAEDSEGDGFLQLDSQQAFQEAPAQPFDADAAIANLAGTHAVRAAAVVRVPELLTLIARIMRESTEHYENAIVLTRNDLPRLCVDILSRVQNVRDDLVHLSIEMLWNLLEISHERTSAAASGSYGDAALTLVDLLAKHRDGNAVRMLGSEFDVRVLGRLLQSCLVQAGATQADREFRNDVLVVASLVAGRPQNRPFFASTGYLALLLQAATAAESASSGGAGGLRARRLRATVASQQQTSGGGGGGDGSQLQTDNFSSVAPVDLEFKQLVWGLIAQLCAGEFADRDASEVAAFTEEGDGASGGGGAARGAARVTCLSEVRASAFVPTLLRYLDASATHGSAYLAAWSPPARRRLEVQALHLLATFGQFFAREIVQAGGLEILCTYLRHHSHVVLQARLRAGDSLGAGAASARENNNSSSSSMDEGDEPYLVGRSVGASDSRASARPPRPQAPGQVPPRPPAAVRIGGTNALVGAGAGSGALASGGEDDVGRQVWAMRVLHALSDIDARGDPSAHLSSFLTAGVPTTVAMQQRRPSGALARPLSAGSLQQQASAATASAADGPRTGAVGHEIAARLGELGLINDLVVLLKRREVDREAERAAAAIHEDGKGGGGSSALQSTAAAAVIARLGMTGGGSGGGGSGRGQGITEVTPSSATEEGRRRIDPELLTEEALLLLAALTRGAADAQVALLAHSLHAITGLADEVARTEQGTGNHLGPGVTAPPSPGTLARQQVEEQRAQLARASHRQERRDRRRLRQLTRRRRDDDFGSLEEREEAAKAVGDGEGGESGEGEEVDEEGDAADDDDAVDATAAAAAAAADEQLREREAISVAVSAAAAARERRAAGRGTSVGGSVGGGSAGADEGHGPPVAVGSTASTGSVHVSLVSRLRANQDLMRKCGGVSLLVRFLRVCVGDAHDHAGGEFSTTGARPRVAIAAAYAVRCACVGNVRSEARLLADGGVDALLDLAEAAPTTLRPVALTAIADLSRNPISHSCVRCWRSERAGTSAGRLLLRLWAEEEARLGVVHEAHTGAIDNLARPLDGGNSAARQAAIFSASHSPTAAAVKDIVAGGRIAILAANQAAGLLGGSHGTGVLEAGGRAGRRGSVIGETSAFRGLRRALRAARLWQHVESATPGGPLATPVLQTDLRHKLYAILQAVGFNEMEAQLVEHGDAEGASAGAGAGAPATAVRFDEEEKKGEESVRGRAGAASSASVHQLTRGAETFPDLLCAQRVSLELCKASPELIVGSAWDDVRTRMAEMKVAPVDSDRLALEAQLEASANVAARVRKLQLIHANADARRVIEGEHLLFSQVLDRREAEEAALKFAEKNKRRPWAQSGKVFTGLTLEEKKAGQAARAQMLQNSLRGYQPHDGMPPATTDD